MKGHLVSLCSLLLVISTSSGIDAAAEVPLSIGGVRATAKIKSFHEMRQERVVRQRWDLSCGSAALSTILTHHHRNPIPESEIIVWILRRTDPVKIRTRGGFSLFDLKRFLNSRGYEGSGYAELTLEELRQMGPALVPIRTSGYDHFVVFWDVIGNRVVLSDPAYGQVTASRKRFLKMWKNGIAFTIKAKDGPPPPPLTASEMAQLPVPDLAAVGRLLRGAGPVAPTRRLQ